MNETDLANLRHALGAVKHVSKRVWGFRRHFVATIGSKDHESMLRLEAAGCVVSRATKLLDASGAYFLVTEAGCQAAGLDETQTRRAMTDPRGG